MGGATGDDLQVARILEVFESHDKVAIVAFPHIAYTSEVLDIKLGQVFDMTEGDIALSFEFGQFFKFAQVVFKAIL